eukprot:GAHX01000009.1.p1 GENE.GAHX01000009.1~~GAHX01000009.1.p1  ORF type:complete len:385 (+),score=70.41 GAHX01000009.1:858-2012(+)
MSTKLREYQTSSRRKKLVISTGIALILITTTVLIVWFAGRGEKVQITPKNPRPSSSSSPLPATESEENTSIKPEWPKLRIESFSDPVHDLIISVYGFLQFNTLVNNPEKKPFDTGNPIMSINPINKDLFNNYKILYISFYNCYKGRTERNKSFGKQTKKQKETNLAIEVLEYVKQLNKFYTSLELTTNKLLNFESNEKLKVQEVVANYLFGFNLSLLMGFMVLRNKELLFAEERLKSNKSLNDLTQHYLKEMEELSKEAYADKKEIEIINGKQAEIHWVKDYDKFLKLAKNVIGLLYLTIFTIDDELNVIGIWEPVSVFLNTNLENGDKVIKTMIDEICANILVDMGKRYSNDKGIEDDIKKECFEQLTKAAYSVLENYDQDDK